MRVVEPAPLSSEEGASLASLAATLDKIAFDSQVQLALWVFNRERDYINLYKCYEIVYDGAGRRRTNDWMGTANAQALHTHGE